MRQLESLIRLSEALARVYCSKLIKREHVEEARRLLGNSIIRIERDEFEIDMVGEQNEQDMDIENAQVDEDIVVSPFKLTHFNFKIPPKHFTHHLFPL